jgi:hypothetical protein
MCSKNGFDLFCTEPIMLWSRLLYYCMALPLEGNKNRVSNVLKNLFQRRYDFNSRSSTLMENSLFWQQLKKCRGAGAATFR